MLLPNLVGSVNINNNAYGGIHGAINFGNAVHVTPKRSISIFIGSGGGNTGNFIKTNNLLSTTNTGLISLKDQIISENQ
ncbi:spore germination protein [Ammoniphilus sp. CFH 90114]|uniref:spore germination protein n=1 Tax=Ammoniphilus sp. CFH 90114 TaxID=2493665 RepID=UPI00100FB088|nr:spore germination protein [Ammoniphilus sp. CFH 90114]RXT07995.1 spore germination protein [Ammoniphilus sp. CFH 90114]